MPGEVPPLPSQLHASGMSPSCPNVNDASTEPAVFELRSKNCNGRAADASLGTNQFDRSPSFACTSLPVVFTVPLDPLICTLFARPPSSPRPLRAVTVKDRSVPTLYLDWTVDTGTL